MFITAVERFISDYSAELGVDREAFIENTLIDAMARIAADEQYGGPVFLMQFCKVDGEVLRGKKLFDFLEVYYRDGMAETPQEEFSAMAERAAELQSNLAKVKQLQVEGLIPADFYGPSGNAVTYCELFRMGKMTRERLDFIMKKYKRSE